MAQLLIIADDITGATDTGVQFARAGLATLVSIRSAELPEADVLVVSTHSRQLLAADAVARTKAAAAESLGRAGGPRLVYKKIDSTLRGHPGAELNAVLDACSAASALVAPALPAQGRTTVGGRQLVDGLPLEQTAFGDRVATSDVVALLQQEPSHRRATRVELATVRRGTAAVEACLDRDGPGLFVADAESESDLETLARAALAGGITHFCGSAGLASALQAAATLQPVATRIVHPPRPRGAVLVVAGSRHARTRCQVELADKEGVPVVPLEECARAVEIASAELAAGRSAILATTEDHAPGGARQVAARLGNAARQLVNGCRLGGLVLTGGGTATAVCTALSAATLCLEDEVEPGVARGFLLDGPHAGLPVVTKAGGFGTDAALYRAIRQLDQSGAD